MRFPETAILHPYSITLRADAEACSAANCTGQYLEDDHIVMYDPQRPFHVQVDTILHELLHAIFAQAGLNSIVDSVAEGSDGERLIRALTPRLIALLRDNPFLVRAIQRA